MSAGPASCPGVADVARIAAMEDRVVRNLAITQCYAELSHALAARTGGAVNWCTFATWASRQAGATIRGEDLLDRLDRHLGRTAEMFAPLRSIGRWLLRRGLFAPDTRLGRVVAAIHSPFDAFERASEAVARGNLKVFDEIGREFARYLAGTPGTAGMVGFTAGLRKGPPPDGQGYLQDAFAAYEAAGAEGDAAIRAAWVLFANLKIGLHEQTRLQPEIAAAIEAPVVTAHDLGARILRIAVPASLVWPSPIKTAIVAVVGSAALRLRRVITPFTRAAITDAMMILALPGTVLSLGRTIDAPVPDVLWGVRHPVLEAFVREHDPCADGVGDCGARDWSVLPQRMHFILHLFRAYAVETALLQPPFNERQVAALRAGGLPDGRL